MLLNLFAFGSLIAFAAGSFDLLVGGWEIVGITSVLLIAFFQLRTPPVENALRVFAVYRACDIGLLVGVFAMHHWAGTASFADGFPDLRGSRATTVCLLLLLAAAGKAAQVPFSGWLPRAMEGPTPSSAIFYGAISIHAGAYLLLRLQPMLAHSGFASAMVVADRADHGDLWHDVRPGKRRCKNLAGFRIADSSGAGIHGNRARPEVDRCRSHPLPDQYGGIGPWQVWIVNLKNSIATLYRSGGSASSSWIDLQSWKDDASPQWQSLD